MSRNRNQMSRRRLSALVGAASNSLRRCTESDSAALWRQTNGALTTTVQIDGLVVLMTARRRGAQRHASR